jgi:hypothetical protein
MILAVRRFSLLVVLYTGAVLAAIGPPLGTFGSDFISTGLPGHGEAAPGDHLQAAYRFWLVGHQLIGGHAPWIDPYSFQPLVDPQVVFGGWPFGLVFWPLDALFGPVLAWNVLLVLVAVACGLLTFAWLEELHLPPWSAALGGLAFAVAPYRLAQSGPHLLGWAALFLPLALLACERSRRSLSPAGAHLWGGVAALALVSIPLSGQLHLALGVLPFVFVYALVRFRGTSAIWVGIGVLAAVGAGLLVSATTIAGSTEAGGRPLSEVTAYSADWVDLVSRGQRGGFEQFVYLGWLTPLLAGVGLVVLARRRPGLATLLLLGALVPALLALGTNFPLYELVRDVLPPFRGPRVPGRLLPVADLALAALAAVAAGLVAERMRSGRRTLAAAALVVLVAADLTVFPLHSSAADPSNESYAQLASAPPGRVLELPILEKGAGQLASVYLYYGMQAPRERPAGYAAAPPEGARDFVERFNRLDCGIWLPEDEAELARLGIRYLVVHGGLYRFTRQEAAESFAARALARRSGGLHVFPPVGEASDVKLDRTRPYLCDGWNADRELKETEGGAWIYGSGRLLVELSGPGTIFVDGRSAEESPTLPGEQWHSVLVRGSPGLRLTRLALEGG